MLAEAARAAWQPAVQRRNAGFDISGESANSGSFLSTLGKLGARAIRTDGRG